MAVVDGKGLKDGVGFFGETTASLVRAWLAVHPDPRPSTHLFVTSLGQALGEYGIVRILHRLSQRAGLARKIGPHALRHYAATAILRPSRHTIGKTSAVSGRPGVGEKD